MHAAGGFGGSGFHLACFGMRGHTALAAVRIIGEHLGAGDRNAEGHSAAAIASLGVLQIVAEGEAGAGPRGGQTMLDLLLAIEVRLRARVMLGACETVDPIGGELGIAGLVSTVEAGDQLNTLELQIGLSVPAVQIVETGDSTERVGHGGAVLVREVHGPLASDALRRVDAAECLDHLRRQVGVPADGVDPEQVTACGRLAVQPGPQSADASAVPRMQRDDRVDRMGVPAAIGPLADIRQGGAGTNLQREHGGCAVAGVRHRRVQPCTILKLHIGELDLGGVEDEITVLAGHVRVLQIMDRNLGGLVGDGFHGTVGGCLDLRRVRLVAAVGVVAELVGEAEAQVVDDAVIGGGSKSTVLGDAPVGDHRAGLSGWDNDRALVGFPVVGMVPRFVAAFRGVHGIGVRVGDGSHIAGLVPVFRSGLGDRGAGQFDWGEMILVGAGEQCHAARVAFGAAGVADTERVAGAGRRVHGLGDGTARMHVGGRVPVLLAMQFEVLVAADGIEILPGERGGGQAAGLHARLSGHGLRVGADRALIGLHIHPGQALPLLGDRPLRGVEPAVHGQLVARGPGGDGLHLGVRSLERGRLRGIRLRIGGHLALVVLLQIMHRQAGSGFVSRESDTARGLGFGGLDGVLLAVLIGWHAAGRVRRILVVRELVRLVEA